MAEPPNTQQPTGATPEQPNRSEPRTDETERATAQDQGARARTNAPLPIREASHRYTDALKEHNDPRQPETSRLRAAMAESQAFQKEQSQLERQIALATDPATRDRLQTIKQIERHEYLALTSEREAKQMEIRTGKFNIRGKIENPDADKLAKKAQEHYGQAFVLRKHLRQSLNPDPRPPTKTQPDKDKHNSPQLAQQGLAPSTPGATRAVDRYAALIKAQNFTRETPPTPDRPNEPNRQPPDRDRYR